MRNFHEYELYGNRMQGAPRIPPRAGAVMEQSPAEDRLFGLTLVSKLLLLAPLLYLKAFDKNPLFRMNFVYDHTEEPSTTKAPYYPTQAPYTHPPPPSYTTPAPYTTTTTTPEPETYKKKKKKKEEPKYKEEDEGSKSMEEEEEEEEESEECECDEEEEIVS
jgi:hypothetical protein